MATAAAKDAMDAQLADMLQAESAKAKAERLAAKATRGVKVEETPTASPLNPEKELRAAGEELRAGKLSEDSLALFRRNAQSHPNDFRAQARHSPCCACDRAEHLRRSSQP